MIRSHLAAVAALLTAAALVGACGPSQPPGAPDGQPPVPTASAPATAIATTPPPPPPATIAPPVGPPAAPSQPILKSTMLAEVGKLVDLKKLPAELAKVPIGQKKKIMPFFQQSLGFKDCTGCHAPGAKADEVDFKKDTRNMQIARKMWEQFVVGLRFEGGENLFCDSCHNGKEHLLDRSDKKALAEFMKVEYEGKLVRADGEDHSCSTCHTDAFEPAIIEKLWAIK